MNKLNNSDYKKLLKFYNIKTPKNISRKNLVNLGNKVLSNKLCRCIKNVDRIYNNYEKSAIAICRNSIFKNKNLEFSKFTCKKKNKIYKLKKTRKLHLKN